MFFSLIYIYLRLPFVTPDSVSLARQLEMCSIAQEGERASPAQQGSQLIGCHFLVTTLVDKPIYLLNLYQIVRNWFISVFINVFLYWLALSSKAISC